ncbi:hypothetical protein SAMN02745119_02235 [Trichlorobacter thiogenes]|uniref:Lipocalin-like domain-containing protein n=1 Tax=Trichlorobacter thiogenes TaxID=115783 RepID=A0A1T4Q6A6_9BACT|nr:hypothetical protein [Trichlorobacter thiogenes]SJZ98768.1 hypothetical protein SAMN02745119_02235 [Trichlorobacter thiogenes]
MKTTARISIVALFCMTFFAAAPAFSVTLPEAAPKFTGRIVVNKTMVSSGYPNGSMTFNSNGSLTCTNYPSFIGCKHWQIQHDGTLRREFTDSHTGKTVEVVAIWKLLSQSGNTLQVQQTSNNSDVATTVTVTIK